MLLQLSSITAPYIQTACLIANSTYTLHKMPKLEPIRGLCQNPTLVNSM